MGAKNGLFISLQRDFGGRSLRTVQLKPGTEGTFTTAQDEYRLLLAQVRCDDRFLGNYIYHNGRSEGLQMNADDFLDPSTIQNRKLSRRT